MQRQTNNPDLECFRVFGYLSLLAAACLSLLFLANIRARYYFSAPNFSGLGYFAAYAVIVGWGLVRLRLWAVVSFAVPLSVYGIVLGVSSVLKQPDARTGLLAIGWAIVLSTPIFLTVRRWDSLKKLTLF